MRLFLNIHNRKYTLGELSDDGEKFVFRYDAEFLKSSINFLYNNSFPLTDEEHIIEYDKLSGFLWDYSPNGYSFLLCENICKDIRKIPSHSFIKMLHKNCIR